MRCGHCQRRITGTPFAAGGAMRWCDRACFIAWDVRAEAEEMAEATRLPPMDVDWWLRVEEEPHEAAEPPRERRRHAA